MKNKKSYLNQYFDMKMEWYRNGLSVDNVTEVQLADMKELRAKALSQSGLTCNELAFICRCRKHGIF